ncbi:MAG TPA: HAD-IIIA family hydrolase [Nitrospirae bacterium]|nr:HAD-IIIA family hydrolase [Nitrospirota bacterium]
MSQARPRQAVILAGGKGLRLRPLTQSTPKPMILVNGRPFLEYLIENLKENGFEKILLLLGYLPDKIRNHFKDGESFGVSIEYSVTQIENDTGARIKRARDMLDPCFLLMYCDNYWPLRADEMWERFKRSRASAQITVYSNKDDYTKDNVRLGENGVVEFYDKSRASHGLKGVDIGYALIKRDAVFPAIDSGNVSFEGTAYPKLAEKGELTAFVTDHRYYSIGSRDRMQTTKRFLARRPAVILDRDGVLNEKPPKAQYVEKWSQFKWLPGSVEAIRLLRANGYTIIVITNQAGVARGIMTKQEVEDIHKKMSGDLENANLSLDAIYYCPHGWDDDCECRKPLPGMLYMAQREFHLDLTKTYFIGDDIRDKQAGDAAGCPCLLVSKDKSLLDLVGAILGNSVTVSQATG